MISTTSPTIGSPTIRIVVVDDQPLFVAGIKMVIESAVDLEFVGSASDGLSAVEVVGRLRPDIVLMDVRMPVLDGIEATRQIVHRSGDGQLSDGEPRVIVLTTFQRDEAVLRAIRAGASGFVTKDATPEFVLAAVRLVHAGQSVLAPKATFDLIRQFASGPRGVDTRERAIVALSPREREIFLLAARGLSNAEIAASAFVSDATVKTHIRSILSKLALQNRVQIVVFAYENSLVTA